MKVLHISPSYKPAFIYGGPTVSVSRLCEELVKSGAYVSVYTTTANGKDELAVTAGEEVELEGVSVTYFGRLTGDHTHFSPALLWSLWKNGHDFDLIHIHAWWNLVSVFSLLLCRFKGWKTVLAPRGMLSQYAFEHENSLKKKLIHQTIGKYLLPYSVLHATTPLEVRDCHQIIPCWKYVILPNIIKLPEEKYSDTLEKKKKDKVLDLIFLSRVDPKKGLELLFSALVRVSFKFRLHIYGNREDTYEQALRTLSSDLKLDKHIYWHGWIEGEDKFKALAGADLFVLTSYNENFANVVLESLSVGTPVLLSDKVGLADYVDQNKLGWVCKLDSQNVADELHLAGHEIKLKKSIVNKNQVLKDFDPNLIAIRYLKTYYQLKTSNNG